SLHGVPADALLFVSGLVVSISRFLQSLLLVTRAYAFSAPLLRRLLYHIICETQHLVQAKKKWRGYIKRTECVIKSNALPPQRDEQLKALEELYQSTKDVRLRTRAQIIWGLDAKIYPFCAAPDILVPLITNGAN